MEIEEQFGDNSGFAKGETEERKMRSKKEKQRQGNKKSRNP